MSARLDPTANRALSTFRALYRREPDVIVYAPGRVNLLGEHVDYNDGCVLPAAIARAVYVAAGRREDGLAALRAADLGEDALFRLSETAARRNAAGGALPGWALYPAGVAHVLATRGLSATGLDAVIASNLPRGAGLSSSAALEVAFARAWRALGGWTHTDLELALACVEAERGYVGVACGVMDQVASACGSPGEVLFLDCRTLEHRAIALPAPARLVVADTSVRRELATSAYNERRAQCAEALRLLSAALPTIRALRDVSSADLARHASLLPPLLRRRARHVVEEIERVRHAVESLERGLADEVGALMLECHESLRSLYDVSSPELDAMVDAAKRISGCYGARLTGAGFGGSVLALVHRDAVDAGFADELARAYRVATGRDGNVFACA